jgi:FkbM family methyltransferase
MLQRQKLLLASLLYSHLFPLYRVLYFRYKKKKDRFHMALIRELVKPGSNVLDIGSNIGFFTKYLSAHTGSGGRVYAFEPDKTNFGHLEKEVKGLSNVTPVQKAVGAASGTIMLYTSPWLNVDHRTYEPETYRGNYTVEQVSIDDFVDGKFRVDFIKMDIQGFEADALKGMKKTLRENPHVLMLMELWPHGLEKAGSWATEIYDDLTSLGFIIYSTGSSQLRRLSRAEVAKMDSGYFTDVNVLLSKKDLFLNL